MWPALDDIGARDMMMFASDYTHWDFDDTRVVQTPSDWRDAVMDGKARRLYRLGAPRENVSRAR